LNRLKSTRHYAVALTLLAITALIGGCFEDNPVIVEEEQWVDALLIIPDPLAPQPGELTRLTALATGEGDWATYDWWVEAGALQDNEGITVMWEAPQDVGTYEVRLIATVGASADTVRKTVMVRNYEKIETDITFNFKPIVHNGTLFFAGSELNPVDEEFFGFMIYGYQDPFSSLNLTGCNLLCTGSMDYVFPFDVGNGIILGASKTFTNLHFRQYPQNIFLWDMDGVELPVAITEELVMYNIRANRNIYPQATDDLNMITWEHHAAGESEDGSRDLFNIKFYNRDLDTKMLLTHSMDSTVSPYGTSYRFFSNIKPLITPNNDYIIYFVDTSRAYEPCMIEIVGGLPDTLTRTALMVPDEDYGIFYEAGVDISENTFFDWCPQTYDILAFIDGDGNLCFFYPYTEPYPSVDKLTDLGMVSEFAWSPDGEQFAVVTEEGLGIGMTLSGAVQNVFYREKLTDDIIGITWSNDMESDPKIAFRLVRKGRTTIDSFSSLVIYSIDEDDWYYALPRIRWTREIEVDYHMNKTFFDSDNAGIYLPVPTESRSVIYHSYE
jgi:hypothetical protein